MSRADREKTRYRKEVRELEKIETRLTTDVELLRNELKEVTEANKKLADKMSEAEEDIRKVRLRV